MNLDVKYSQKVEVADTDQKVMECWDERGVVKDGELEEKEGIGRQQWMGTKMVGHCLGQGIIHHFDRKNRDKPCYSTGIDPRECYSRWAVGLAEWEWWEKRRTMEGRKLERKYRRNEGKK